MVLEKQSNDWSICKCHAKCKAGTWHVYVSGVMEEKCLSHEQLQSTKWWAMQTLHVHTSTFKVPCMLPWFFMFASPEYAYFRKGLQLPKQRRLEGYEMLGLDGSEARWVINLIKAYIGRLLWALPPFSFFAKSCFASFDDVWFWKSFGPVCWKSIASRLGSFVAFLLQ